MEDSIFESDLFDDILDEDDIKEINKLVKFKKDLMTYIGVKPLIDKIREIIDAAPGLDFKSEVSRKFIDNKKPVFVLKIIDEEILNQVNELKSENEYTNFITTYIGEEVSKKVTSFIMKNIEENEILKELHDSLSEELRNLTFTNIYIIRASKKENTIYFEYFI